MIALDELVPIAILLFCLAFVWCARKLLAAIFQSLIDAVNSVHIPYLGEAISGVLHSMEQSVDNALGRVESGIDSLVGGSWHQLAKQCNLLWSEFRRHALLIGELTPIVSTLVNGYEFVRGLIHDAHRLYSSVAGRVKSLEREWHGIEAKVKNIEHDLSKGIGHDLRIGLKVAEKEIQIVAGVDIPAIRSDVSQADVAISNLYDWARGKAALLGVGTFAAAVAAVIGVDALRALKCPEFLKSFGRRGCGLFQGLEDILGLFVDLFIIADFCDVIPLLEQGYSDVAAPAISALTSAIDAMPCVQGNQAPALNVPALYLPSNPGIALSLP